MQPSVKGGSGDTVQMSFCLSTWAYQEEAGRAGQRRGLVVAT